MGISPKLQENEGCAGLSKVTVMDEDGFLVEEEGSELEEDEARLSDAGDQDVSDKPVTKYYFR